MKTTLFQSGVEDTWGIVLTFKWRRVLRLFGNIPWRYFVSGGKMMLQHTEERGWNEWGVVVALLNEFTEIFVYNFFEGFCWEGNEFHPITFLQMSNFVKFAILDAKIMSLVSLVVVCSSLLLNDSVSLVLRCQMCRKFTWTLYIQYSYIFL